MTLNLQQALERAKLELESSDSARLDAELLLAAVLKKSRTFLRAFSEIELTSAQLSLFTHWVERRKTGEPIAYILQEKEFWSLPLKVNASVLVPRAETECLVEAALLLLPKNVKWSVADFGTGSGAIALALANERPGCEVFASDIDSDALQVARENAKKLALRNIQFIEDDWGRSYADHSFEMIVSNPPYVDVLDQHIEIAVQQFQPKRALFADNKGLAAISCIVQQATRLLKDNGYLLLEHGFQQQADVAQLLVEHDFTILEEGKDFAGLPRFMVAHKKSLKQA